jgi:hypothetical protein
MRTLNKSKDNRSMYDLVLVNDVQALIDNWHLFRAALQFLDSKDANLNLTDDEMFKQVSAIATGTASYGSVFLVKNPETGQHIGCFIVVDDSRKFANYRQLCLYLAYSLDPKLNMREFSEWALEYAKEFGYDLLVAQTARLNGAIKRIYGKHAGFTIRSTMWERKINV